MLWPEGIYRYPSASWNSYEKGSADCIFMTFSTGSRKKAYRWDKLELMIHDQYRTASGFVSYASNFINLFLDSSRMYVDSLRSYRMSLDSLYTSHCNEDIHKLNATIVETIGLMKEQNDESSVIAKRMNWYTLAMLAFTCVNVIVAICQAFHVW